MVHKKQSEYLYALTKACFRVGDAFGAAPFTCKFCGSTEERPLEQTNGCIEEVFYNRKLAEVESSHQ